MADTKLSSLTAASALAGTELFYSDDGAADVKVTAAQIKTFTSASPTLVTPALGVATATSVTATGFFSARASSSGPHLDVSGASAYSVATGTNAAITPTGAGPSWLVFINETALNGQGALYVCSGSNAPILLGGGASFAVGSSPSSFGVAWDGGTSTYRVYNGIGSTASFKVLLLRAN